MKLADLDIRALREFLSMFNRIYALTLIVLLAGWLAYIKVPPSDIAAIVSPIAVAAGVYVTIKGKGVNGG
jgi:hypothetical protein